jgi:hypothetical protein
MSKTIESELRPLKEHELEHVSGGLSGINALIGIAQMKADNANNNALEAASKQTGSHWISRIR